MIAYDFDLQRPATVEEAAKALARAKDAKILAGGHSLVPLLKLGLAQPATIVDISGIAALREIRVTGDTVRIGALATHQQVAEHPAIRERLAALAEAAAAVGDLQVRARGTIGGSLAHADPGADEPAAVLALDATIHATGPKGERRIPARDLFKGTFETALAADEILTAVTVAAPKPRSGSAYEKFPHPASRFAVVGVAVAVTLDGAGKVAHAAVAVSGAADRPFRAAASERALQGTTADAQQVSKAAAAAVDGVRMLGDLAATSEFRAHLVTVYARRAIERAVARARG